MKSHSYYSDPTTKNSSLAEASWDEFSKFLSRYQWAFDHPSASPRKLEIAHALNHRGEKGSCTFQREDGWKFVLRPLRSWAFEQAIERHRKIFYVSYGRSILLYFDVDLHRVFQRIADGVAAVDEINRTKLPIYWIDSTRGFNGYLKVELSDCSFDEANRIVDRLQNALRRALALAGNLADFEIKGKVGYLKEGQYDWSQYGKLPIHNDKWSWSELKKFADMRTVSIRTLDKLAAYIEANVPQLVLDDQEDYKKTLRCQPRIENGYCLLTDELKADLESRGVFRDAMFEAVPEGEWGDRVWWIPVEFLQRTAALEITSNELESAEPMTKDSSATSSAIPAVKAKINDLLSEPDSFARQHEALRRFARALKRVPTLEEALDYIRDNGLFTGTWDDNFNRRRGRVSETLEYIGRTFDSAKCSKGSVNVGKYDAWAKKKFPHGIVSDKKRWLTPDGEIIEINHQIHVGPKFIAVFAAVCEFGLLVDKNEDESLPHRRAKEIWNTLYAKKLVPVPFDDRKWAVCREELVERNIIRITDRLFGPGKAMRWAIGRFFPQLGLWKRVKHPSLLEAVDLSDFLEKKTNGTTEEHNTLLQQQPIDFDHRANILGSRSPP